MFLRTVWYLSAGLAAVALVVMACLIGARVFTDWTSRRRRARRQALLASLLQWLEGTITEDHARRLLLKQRRSATSLLIEIFELVRGEDQKRLAALAESSDLPRYLRRTLTTARRADRLSAAESLVWFPSEATRDTLKRTLHDRHPDVALAAASSLADLGETIPIRQVLEVQLGRGVDSPRQLDALLTRIALHQTLELTQLAQDTSANERVRAAVIEALARSGAFHLLDSIAALASDPSDTVRAAVARALGIFAHPHGTQTIVGLLDDPSWEVRAEAAEAHGRIGLLDEAGRLPGLLDDENWWVRFRAGEALAGLGTQGLAILREAAQTGSDPAKRMAGLVLAERGLT